MGYLRVGFAIEFSWLECFTTLKTDSAGYRLILGPLRIVWLAPKEGEAKLQDFGALRVCMEDSPGSVPVLGL